MSADLFGALAAQLPQEESLGEGAVLMRGFAANEADVLWRGVQAIVAAAPFRHLITPGGFRMSVAMSNCGSLGWVSDRRGYRYEAQDPLRALPWPAMPDEFVRLAQRAASHAGFPDFYPEACLINRYEAGARMSLHQDKDEHDVRAPIVSVSLGLPATFLWGGLQRSDRPRRMPLMHGDVVVWGGPSRFVFHGVAPLKAGAHAMTGECRINLTFRRVSGCESLAGTRLGE